MSGDRAAMHCVARRVMAEVHPAETPPSNPLEESAQTAIGMPPRAANLNQIAARSSETWPGQYRFSSHNKYCASDTPRKANPTKPLATPSIAQSPGGASAEVIATDESAAGAAEVVAAQSPGSSNGATGKRPNCPPREDAACREVAGLRLPSRARSRRCGRIRATESATAASV